MNGELHIFNADGYPLTEDEVEGPRVVVMGDLAATAWEDFYWGDHGTTAGLVEFHQWLQDNDGWEGNDTESVMADIDEYNAESLVDHFISSYQDRATQILINDLERTKATIEEIIEALRPKN